MSDKDIPPPPEKPTPHECCGSGCVPCIYDYYYDALEKWQQQYGGRTTDLGIKQSTGNSGQQRPSNT